MPNSYDLWQVFTNRCMKSLTNNLTFLKSINRDTEPLFGKAGSKSGDLVKVRKAIRVVGRSGDMYAEEPLTQNSVEVRVRPLQGVDISVPSTDWVLNLDRTDEDLIQPMMAQLANNVERDCLLEAYRGVGNSVGTFGSALATSTVILQAGAKLSNEGAPDDFRRFLISPNTNVSMVPALQGLFAPSNVIGEQYRKGRLGDNILGFERFDQSQNVPYHVPGPLGGTPLVNGAAQTGSTIVLDGFTAAVGLRLRRGDTLQFVNCNSINPMNRVIYGTGELRSFTVLADAYSDAAGNVIVSIDPPLIPAPAQLATVDAPPADNALVSVFNTAAAGHAALAATSSSMNLAYHKNAFTIAGIKQFLPKGAAQMAWEATNPKIGLSIRYIQDFDTRGNILMNRMDCLYAFAVTESRLACRALGN